MVADKVSVVIVTYNSEKYIKSCLKSVINSHRVNIEDIILVDNASQDNTVRIARETFGKDSRVKIIQLGKNLGFPYASNIGIANTHSKYIVLVNPDVVVDPYCFYSLLSTMSKDERIAASQPKILHPGGYIDGVGGIMDFLGHGFHIGKFEKDIGQYDKPREILYACFACAMIRRGVYLRLGGMDPRYFLYNEDLDFCWRSWLAGYRVVYVPEAVAYHIGQHATSKLPYHAIYFGRRNRLFTIFANYPLLVSIITSFILLGFYVLLGVGSTIKDKAEARLTLKIITEFFRSLKYLSKKRNSLLRKTNLKTFIRKGLITFRLVGLRLYLAKLYRKQLKLSE